MKQKNPYSKAMRYIENAEEALQKAGVEDKFYIDDKYVRTACGTAYSGMLRGLDFLFEIKGIPKKRGRKSIFYYQEILSGLDKKLLNHLNNGYEVLHLYGYYDGGNKVRVIEQGFDDALSIIKVLKPFSKNGIGFK